MIHNMSVAEHYCILDICMWNFSAGIGRSGCFIATSIGMLQLREEHMVDILGIVCSMRLDRSVQYYKQFWRRFGMGGCWSTLVILGSFTPWPKGIVVMCASELLIELKFKLQIKQHTVCKEKTLDNKNSS